MFAQSNSSRRAWRSILAASIVAALPHFASAEDWGAYAISPSGAPGMVLEAVGSGAVDGTIVSIGNPADAPNQKWIVTPKGNHTVAIHPAYSSTLVLAAAKGGKNNGTQLVLETDANQPWQQWEIKKNDNGSYSILAGHIPNKGIDDNGGNKTPGARQDLWDYHPNDAHLQWQIKPLAGLGAAAPEAPAPTYVPPEIKPEAILPGEIKNTTFNSSAIFPGTVRAVTVFIPAQYDGSKPACVYVKTDGYNPREKALMETMIATKEMPVTIGVFVRPGEVPAPMKGTVGRRNRCFEYDGVTDNNVRFFVEELLPFVAKEFNLKLSTSGNDRCVSGGSSGGIAAFTAAWQRPNEFSRVYAASGSFVAFRSGHEYPTLVRKFEAKPIRAFLTTATHDMENCAGDWFVIDQEMDKALKFSGYDYIFRVIEGRHVAGYMENWREAMAYLWKGWPEPVKAGPSAPRAQDILVPNEGWQLVAEGRRAAGPAAANAAGEVAFVDAKDDKIYRLDAEGKISEWVAQAGQANSVTFGADGKLYAVSSATGKITGYDQAGQGSVVAEGVPGHHLLALPGGGFFVTGADSAQGGVVWRVKDGQKKVVDAGLKLATGLAYRPDQWLLSVADGGSKWVNSYQIEADGSLTNKERFFQLHVPDWEDDAGAGEVCYSLEGQMMVATRAGIQVCADDGPTQVVLPLPDRERVLGLCLGGKDLDTLYAFDGDKIWKRKLKVHALGAASPWTKVNATKL